MVCLLLNGASVVEWSKANAHSASQCLVQIQTWSDSSEIYLSVHKLLMCLFQPPFFHMSERNYLEWGINLHHSTQFCFLCKARLNISTVFKSKDENWKTNMHTNTGSGRCDK